MDAGTRERRQAGARKAGAREQRGHAGAREQHGSAGRRKPGHAGLDCWRF